MVRTKEYTMCVNLKNLEKPKKEKKYYTAVEAMNKKEAIKIINERFKENEDYLGCYVYIDSEREQD